jgi:hypothetical protein
MRIWLWLFQTMNQVPRYLECVARNISDMQKGLSVVVLAMIRTSRWMSLQVIRTV